MVKKQRRTARTEERHVDSALLMDQNFFPEGTLDSQFRRNSNIDCALFGVSAANIHVDSSAMNGRWIGPLFNDGFNINAFVCIFWHVYPRNFEIK